MLECRSMLVLGGRGPSYAAGQYHLLMDTIRVPMQLTALPDNTIRNEGPHVKDDAPSQYDC